jgi:tetraacyldisaccharide 4'-kinase
MAETFGLAIQARLRAAFDRAGAARPTNARVLVVAGTALGGSGKTPVVEWLARRLSAQGATVAIVGHGHRGRGRGVRRVTGARGEAGDVGDEAVELARALPEVPVWVGRPRCAAMSAVRAVAPESWVIFDGGLGASDMPWATTILVDDVTLPGGRFPAGYRRFLPADVPGSCLRWSHRVDEPGAAHSDAPVRSVFRATGLRAPDGRAATLAGLATGRWVALSGIARPVSFHHTLRAAGATIVEHRVFGDHASFPAAALRAPPNAQIIVTRKDAARLPIGAPVWVLTGEVAVVDGLAAVDACLAAASEGR